MYAINASMCGIFLPIASAIALFIFFTKYSSLKPFVEWNIFHEKIQVFKDIY